MAEIPAPGDDGFDDCKVDNAARWLGGIVAPLATLLGRRVEAVHFDSMQGQRRVWQHGTRAHACCIMKADPHIHV